MEPEIYVIINSQGICENKILWDGVTEWVPPEETLLAKQAGMGFELEIGDLAAVDLPNLSLPEDPFEPGDEDLAVVDLLNLSLQEDPEG